MMRVADEMAGRGWVSAARLRRWADSGTGAAALLVLCLALYLPGFFSLPAVDRDESRFAQASRQMLESRDFVIPRVMGQPRLNKPPLVYWAQAACTWVCTGGDPSRDAAWMYRLPSLFAAIGAVFIVWRWGASMYDPRPAWTAAALFAASPVMTWEVRQARADMMLVAFTTASGWLLWEVVKRRRLGRPIGVYWLALWLAVGLGIMQKGPIAPMVVILTTAFLLVVERRWRTLLAVNPVLGLALAAALIAPWVYLVARAVGFDHYRGIVMGETVGRSSEAMEGHGGPPLFHAAFSILLFWPGAMWVGLGLWRGFATGFTSRPGEGSWLARVHARLSSAGAGRPQELFLLAWLLPSWYVFEMVSTKLPHYTMPLYPALALLAARAAWSNTWVARVEGRPLVAWLARGWAAMGVALIVAVAGIAALALCEQRLWFLAGLAAGAGAALVSWFVRTTRALVRAGRAMRLPLPGTCVWLACTAAGLGGLPHLPWPWASREFAAALRSIDPARSRPVATVKYHEDSFSYETRNLVTRVDEEKLKFWVRQHPGALVILPEKRAAYWPRVRPLARVPSYNYSKGLYEPLVLVEFVGDPP